MTDRLSLLFVILLASCQLTFAQSSIDNEDETEREVRENPVIDGLDEDFDITIPSFIRQDRNHISFNGADWTQLRRAAAAADDVPFSIIHIGDSHIQADYATGEIRNNLQFDYGNAGRGLIAPLRMSGTNEPRDYTFSSTQSWNSVKLMSQNWSRTMGFTGTSISPVGTSSNILVGTSEREDYNPFSSITVFHKGQFFVTSVADTEGRLIPFVSTPSKDYTQILLTKDVNMARIYFDSAGDLTIFGVSLSGNRTGVFYHTIGNNGATYETYNRIGNVGEGIAPLRPDLIILSLGTNEAFGRVDKRSLQNSIDRLVENIRKTNPDAAILLVTPMECQKAVYSTVKSKGKKRRRGGQRVKSYKINEKIETVRDVILDYGKQHHIAVYDWYNVAGGDGASNRWIDAGLFSKDRVHHSFKGYALSGLLLYQAIREALSPAGQQ